MGCHPSSVSTNTNINLSGIPTGPINIDEILSEEVTISWGPSVWDGGAPIENYIIEIKDKITNWTRAGRTRGNVTSFTITNLLEGNDYWYVLLLLLFNVYRDLWMKLEFKRVFLKKYF